MHDISVIEKLASTTDSLIIQIILDGVGDIYNNNTPSPLEKAQTPNLDKLARASSLGLADPIFPGITPGSGPGHLALFGYDPLKFNIGRGVLEALGIDLKLRDNGMYARGNFCTLDKNNVILDRRAGRISTDINRTVCEKINAGLKNFKEIPAKVYPVKEHRFVVEFLGEELVPNILDADAQKVGLPYKYAEADTDTAIKTTEKVNKFIDHVLEILKGDEVNGILLRGFAKDPGLDNMEKRFSLRPAAVAQYPMYRGLASLVGMTLLNVGEKMEDIPAALERNWASDHDYYFLHIKKTDSYGEDGNYDGKVHVIEEFDKILPRILALNPDALLITGDHSTPCMMKAHSWHPVPLLLHSEFARTDDLPFTEKNCRNGSLSRINALYEIPLLLAHSGKLAKYGA